MNTHYETAAELSSRRDMNEHDIAALTAKIESINNGIKELRKARRVLARRRRKLFDAQQSLTTRINHELDEIAKANGAFEVRQTEVWQPIVLEK